MANISLLECDRRITALEVLPNIVSDHETRVVSIEGKVPQIEVNKNNITTILGWKTIIDSNTSRIRSIESKLPKIDVNANDINTINGIISVVPIHTSQIHEINAALPQITINKDAIQELDTRHTTELTSHAQRLSNHERDLVPWTSVVKNPYGQAVPVQVSKIPYINNNAEMDIGTTIRFRTWVAAHAPWSIYAAGSNTGGCSGTFSVPSLILGGYSVTVVA